MRPTTAEKASWKRVGLTLGVLSLVTAGTLTLAAPAQAAASSSAIAYTGGTRAAEAFFNRSDGSHANKAWLDVYDAKCDAQPVYVDYKINGKSQPNYFNVNDGGCGTTMGVNLQTGYFTISYRVCVDDGFFSDTCSAWKQDHN